jgi:serine/threonine protein kinase
MASRDRTARHSTPDGEVVGDYRVLDKLGTGGMATVFKVRGPDGRSYALKEMRPQKEAKREMTRRFRQEFEVTSRLDHRNIVGVHDFFAAQDTFHIVMEYVDGLDLRSVTHWAGTLDDGRLARLGVDIAAGMAHAHVQGVLHRDLKPENILLSKRGQVKVVDFGVARVQGTRLTATGIIVGSPAYMSPEQLAGVGGQSLTEAADVYSFGVVLYELGEGRDPLGLKKHEDLLTVLRAKRKKTPRKFRRLLDPDLQGLILSCLEPEPEDRPSSMEELRKRLLKVVRSCSIRRDDLQELAQLAMSNRTAKRRAKGAAAPPPSSALPPEPVRQPPRLPRVPQASDMPPRHATSAVDWAAPVLPPAMSGGAQAATGAGLSRVGTTGVGARRAAGHGPAVAPATQRGVDRWFEKTSPTPAGAVAAGEPTVADELLAVSKSVSSGRVPSRINDLSFKGRRAVDGAGVLSWLALLLFAGAVVFFGASASLTGSPLGLLERWIPMP